MGINKWRVEERERELEIVIHCLPVPKREGDETEKGVFVTRCFNIVDRVVFVVCVELLRRATAMIFGR